jgi:hypothetical protein
LAIFLGRPLATNLIPKVTLLLVREMTKLLVREMTKLLVREVMVMVTIMVVMAMVVVMAAMHLPRCIGLETPLNQADNRPKTLRVSP